MISLWTITVKCVLLYKLSNFYFLIWIHIRRLLPGHYCQHTFPGKRRSAFSFSLLVLLVVFPVASFLQVYSILRLMSSILFTCLFQNRLLCLTHLPKSYISHCILMFSISQSFASYAS